MYLKMSLNCWESSGPIFYVLWSTIQKSNTFLNSNFILMSLMGCLKLIKGVYRTPYQNTTDLTVPTSADAACPQLVQSAWLQVGERVFRGWSAVGHFPLACCKTRLCVWVCAFGKSASSYQQLIKKTKALSGFHENQYHLFSLFLMAKGLSFHFLYQVKC